MVSADWKLARTPSVKNRLMINAELASMPGMKLYIITMYIIKMMKAMMNEMNPCWMDCAPSVGPTTSSCTMRAGAGMRPDFSVFAKSFVSSMVKLPVICEFPPVISLFTRGALYTTPSSTMAMAFPTLALVNCAQRCAPSLFICMLTLGRPERCSNSSFASVTTSPSSGARPLDCVTLSA